MNILKNEIAPTLYSIKDMSQKSNTVFHFMLHWGQRFVRSLRHYPLLGASTLSFLLFFAVLFVSGAVWGQVTSSWGTIPAQDGGRVMPLDSFARQIVTEICGEPEPVFVLDDSVLTELNQILESLPRTDVNVSILPTVDAAPPGVPRFFTPGIDAQQFENSASFLREVQPETATTKRAVLYGITSRTQAEQIIRRIRVLTSVEGLRYQASELLLSWLTEPEVWSFIPIFPANNAEYREEVLEVPLRNNAKVRLRRVSILQLKHSPRFQQRLADIMRRQQQAQQSDIPNAYDQITEDIVRHQQSYENLTFHPLFHRPTRMLGLLHQSLQDSHSGSSSYTSALNAWGYLLALGEVPELQSVEVPVSSDRELQNNLHPTTERWHEIALRIRTLAAAFNRTEEYNKMTAPNIVAVEKQFEQLLALIAANLEESEALMEKIYPGTTYRSSSKNEDSTAAKQPTDAEKLLSRLFLPESLNSNQQTAARLILSYYHSVKTLRNEIEAAYLALYDNGRSLRLLPVCSTLAFDNNAATVLNVQPWGNFQMLMYGGENFVRRFFEPDFELGTPQPSLSVVKPTEQEEELPPEVLLSRTVTPLPTQTETNSETETAPENADALGLEDQEKPKELPLEQKLERELIAGNFQFDFLSQLRLAMVPSVRGGVTAQIRANFDGFSVGYQEVSLRMQELADSLQISLRTAAHQIETARNTLLNPKDMKTGAKNTEVINEVLAKISYPELGATVMEYRYFQLSPFFWMGVFAAVSLFFTFFSIITGQVRYEWSVKVTSEAAPGKESVVEREIKEETASLRFSSEECLLWLGVLMLFVSVFITFVGGAMRAWITGWAPVTNMYETVVLMAFCAMLIGLGFTLAPFVSPLWQIAWRFSSFPSLAQIVRLLFTKKKPILADETAGTQAMREAAEQFGVPGGMPLGTASAVSALSEEERQEQAAQKTLRRTLLGQTALCLPRILLMFLVFYLLIHLSYREYAHQHGVFAAAAEMFKMSDLIDWLVVTASIALIVWYVPHFLLSCFNCLFFIFRPSWIAAEEGISSAVSSESSQILRGKNREMGAVFQGEANALTQDGDNSGVRWLNLARERILDRKLFTLVAAVIALAAALAAYFNTTQFSPDIRPLVAVLRSNFWLTVHVIAIIVSYAAGLAAWGMSAVSLGWLIFGRYQYFNNPQGRSQVLFPAMSEMFAPMIHKLLQIALVMLILGTALGARWADYSWGRFWSWDPKEVWALITILVYAGILHGRIARWYGKVGMMLGALLASIAVIVTWYGINFVFKNSIHSYGGEGHTGATAFLWGFILINILWGFLALFRYNTEVFGRDTKE